MKWGITWATMRPRPVDDVEIVDIGVGVIGPQANRRLLGIRPALPDVLIGLPDGRHHLNGPPAVVVGDAIDAFVPKRSESVPVIAVIRHRHGDVRSIKGDDLEADHHVVRALAQPALTVADERTTRREIE